MRTRALDLRPYGAGDETAIAGLFESSFGRPLPAAFWAWRYGSNPAGGPWIELAWDGPVLAAHYAVSAARLRVDGRDVSAALSMTTMTHPDYRGRGLFPALGGRLYRRLTEAGAAVVYGFPNTQSHRGFVRDLGWRDLYEIPTLRSSVDAGRLTGGGSTAIALTDNVDDRFDRLWERIAATFPTWLRRDSSWLRWRVAAASGHAYVIAAWVDGAEIRGWTVVKRFGANSLDLIDFVAEDADIAADLARWTSVFAHQAGLAEVTTWCPMDAPWRAALEKCGFHPGAPVTYLGARALSTAGAAATNGRNWGFSMADSDVY